MSRRVRWVVAVGLACGGGAFAQPWQPVPATSPEPEPVYVIRTAGQNDRTVKVIHPANPSDPGSLAEVKDTVTGQTFVIPGKVLAKLSKASPTPTDTPPVEMKPTPAFPPVEAKPTPTLPPDQPPAITPLRAEPKPAPALPPEQPPIAIPPRTEPKRATTPMPVAVASTPGERMTITWQADDHPAKAVSVPPALPLSERGVTHPDLAPAKAVSVPPALPPLPTTAQRPTTVTSEPTATPTTTLPPVSSPVTQPLPVVPSSAVTPETATPANADPWRAANAPKVIVPTTPQPTVGPKLTPVPTWRTAPLPTNTAAPNDPWRPTGG